MKQVVLYFALKYSTPSLVIFSYALWSPWVSHSVCSYDPSIPGCNASGDDPSQRGGI